MTEKIDRSIAAAELRRPAKERSGEIAGTMSPPGTAEEPPRPLSEWQVRGVQSEVESLPEKYADLDDFAPTGEGVAHLLLAEDDPATRQVLGLMLMRYDFDLDFAADGQEAVEMWEKGKYDLVLMDIQMPRLNGFEATRAIREKERVRGGHTPIVALTAHAFKEDDERCLAAGMDAHISKPINFKETLELIGRIVKRK